MADHFDILKSTKSTLEQPSAYLSNQYSSSENLVHPKEKLYFGIMLSVSICAYIFVGLSLYSLLFLSTKTFAVLLINYSFFVFLFVTFKFIVHGLFFGHVKANGIPLTSSQFPDTYAKLIEICNQIDLKAIPQVYIMQAGGLLNAFATCFNGHNFVVIYSDIYEMAYQQGEEAVKFVLCHELAHIQRGHTKFWKRVLLMPALCMPFLGPAYHRACEYTCDRYGATFFREGAIQGLMALAAGKQLYSKVSVDNFLVDTDKERGFWTWFSEIFASHPHLTNRLKQVR